MNQKHKQIREQLWHRMGKVPGPHANNPIFSIPGIKTELDRELWDLRAYYQALEKQLKTHLEFKDY